MLIKGEQLNDGQRKQVLAAYVMRNTVEHPFPPSGGTTQTDQQWVEDHAFYFVKDGSRLMRSHHHCEPSYLG
jgi:spore germination cell wall hydrolase CwlJ-like protein